MTPIEQLLTVARGHAPADLVLRGGRVVNVFTGETEAADVAIVDGTIAGVGAGYAGREAIDLAGAFVAPGYIDAHVHIESSLCVPAEFARAVVGRGVTTVVADPHEIANVAGLAGVEWMCAASRGLPLEVIVMAPSCVPATLMGTAGGRLDAADIAGLRARGAVRGLAEFMNFPGVIGGDAAALAKLDVMRGLPVDGHCPGVRGHALSAYVAAGVGSDHECVDVAEAREKLARGLYLLIREATNARNLDALLPLVTHANARRICFCTDDRTPGDLLREGSIDMMVRRAIAFGIDPIEAIRMATLNPAEWFGLNHVGAIAPGRTANLIVFDDLNAPTPRLVYARGKDAVAWASRPCPAAGLPATTRFPRDARAAGGRPLGMGGTPMLQGSTALGRCVINWSRFDLKIPARGERTRVIGARADQLLTDALVVAPRVVDGRVEADVARDLLKICVAERHGASGNCGVGFVRGFGLIRGAIAGTVAHDHHNLVAIGADDASMTAAAREVERLGGGLVVADGERIVASLALEVGGLMSDGPIERVAADYDALVAAARALGSPLVDPFMAMSFMALEVIPRLKLTDQGLVDVEAFRVVDLFVGG